MSTPISWKQNLHLDGYKQLRRIIGTPYIPHHCPDNQYILRMLVKRPGVALLLPDDLKWLRPAISLCCDQQRQHNIAHSFMYITVRCGPVASITDDQWHVDGFSMRVPHVPEQNYIWSDGNSMHILNQPFNIPPNFDPFVHNLHTYFQDRADESLVIKCESNHIYAIDPYVIHRRPVVQQGTIRRMFRISFIPIEIEDDTCTQNPLLPSGPYNRMDIRTTLVRYKNSC